MIEVNKIPMDSSITNSANKYKIVNVVLNSAHLGGVESYVVDLTKYGINAGYDIKLISLENDSPSQQFKELGIEIITLNNPILRSVGPLHNIYHLYRALRKIKPNAVHLHGTRPMVFGGIAAKLAGVRKIIATVHYSYKLMCLHKDGSIDKKRALYGKLIYLTGFRFCNRIITVSDWMSEEAKEIARELPFYNLRKLSQKLITIHVGLSVHEYYKTDDKTKFKQKCGIDEDTTIIGTALRLDPKKGGAFLLRAANILKNKDINFKLLIAGEGYEKEQLINLIEKLNLQKHVLLLGYLGREKLREMFSVLDIFVLPSLSEGFPIVNLEAMASSLPVVSTNVGGVPEALRENVNGLLVKPGDEYELADALIYLIQNPNIAKEMGRKGREIVENEFKKEEQFRRIVSFYR
jgi:glycosyltransferase involved in cell wall biosynthesis